MKNTLFAVMLFVSLCLTGCEDNDFDHVPPNGQGSLAIANHTDDLEVYIDGEYLDKVGDYDDKVFDLDPGLYRLTLTEQHGDRYFSGYIDVLDGRITEVDVENGRSYDEYNVDIEFD